VGGGLSEAERGQRLIRKGTASARQLMRADTLLLLVGMSRGNLFDRKAELAFLGGLIARVPEAGRAIVLRGEAGIGKSSLLAEATIAARTRGMRVLTATGVQSETRLPFAGLHQLLRPVLAGRDYLPGPQRVALESAFGLSDAPRPELFLIALGALELLGDVATRNPVLLVAEDAQWLDRPTCEVLAFVARRIESEPIVLIAAVRDGHESPFDDAGLSELHLERLDDATSAELLDARAPGLAPELRRRLLNEAGGNPLALVELPNVAQAGLLSDEGFLLADLPLTSRLEKAFALRLSDLSPSTRWLLLIAAAEDRGVLAEVMRATTFAGGAENFEPALAAAVKARFLEVSGTELHFRHPLVRSAVYQSASVSERRAAHVALADALNEQPDRRAWHRAAASIGPDESVADELEATALRAQQRGGVAVAAAAWERAARLSTDPSVRAARLLLGAELAFEIGRKAIALRLLNDTEGLELGPREQARRVWIRENLPDSRQGDPTQVATLIKLADDVRLRGDADLALKLLHAAALRAWWAEPGPRARERVFEAAERLGVDELDPRLLAVLAVATPTTWSGVVLERLARIAPSVVADPDAALSLGLAAHVLSDYERSATFVAAAEVGLRARGSLALLAKALVVRAWGATELGRWDLAQAAAEEGGRLAEETGQLIEVTGSQITLAILAGLRGEEHVAKALAEVAERTISTRRLDGQLGLLQMARGMTALTVGRFGDAYDHLRRMFDPADPAHHQRDFWEAINYFAEAAAQTGHHDEARNIVDRYALMAAQNPSLRMIVLFSRPLLANDEDAGGLFESALAADTPYRPFLRARLQLEYGVWLRRHRRASDSRAPLRTARETFDALGAAGWADRARRELRASGETSRPRTPLPIEVLTPQELQIARMASAGLTNPEIAQQLYISRRTVSTHLYRLFPKLGITSRSQLSSVLDAPLAADAEQR
jgi:DNA-binding CsgD family transcriptional regulator/tetratricopeptide (TPR) repeat protein